MKTVRRLFCGRRESPNLIRNLLSEERERPNLIRNLPGEERERPNLIRNLLSEEQEEGQSIVELAIALPILLTILGGILDFGWIYMNQYRTEYAAYAGARYASMYVQDLDSAALQSGVESRVKANFPTNLRGNVSVSAVTQDTADETVSVTVTLDVPTLTFVANGIFGATYEAESTSVAAY